MKGLDSVIRVHEWKLDEKRKKVSELERLAQRLHGQLADLDRELKTEQKIAGADQEVAGIYGNFAAGVIRRREKIIRSLAEIEQALSQALDEVAAAFREFKKFDIIRQRNRERSAFLEKRRQQGELDEAGLGVFRRRTSS